MNRIPIIEALPSREEVSAPQLPLVEEDSNNTILAVLPAVLTPEQVAEVLQISTQTIRQMLREGFLPAFKCGAQWRIPREWLADFINGGGSHG